ncbi:serine hydrolase domain-containing protein [soil metagenome]
MAYDAAPDASTAQAAGVDPQRLQRAVDHLRTRYVEPQKISGCQLVVHRRGHTVLKATLGSSDLERGAPLRDDAIFRIYSVTKPITSVALMQLFELGLFQLDDPVASVIPEWAELQVWVSGEGDQMVTEPCKRPMSFRDLLRHTSGLTYGTLLETVGAPAARHPVDQLYKDAKIRATVEETLDDFIAKLAKIPLRYQPGEAWMYSLATDVIGAVVERICGMRFDAYLQEYILGPLGMKDTSFSVPEAKRDRFGANYMRDDNRKLKVVDDPQKSFFLTEPAFLSGGGGLVGTIDDYLRFCRMLLNGGELDGARILNRRTIELMRANHLPDGGDLTGWAIGLFSETVNTGIGFGLGFASSQSQVSTGQLSAGEYYWGGAASTIFWVDPAEDLAVIFMTQLMPSSTFNFRGQLKSLIYSALED